MGNCLTRCCSICDKRRKYLRTHYNVERDFSIEFENLMDDDAHEDMNRPLTDNERHLLSAKRYDAIVHEQRKIDAEIDAKLAQQEEEIEREEESYYEAKREAARVSRMQRAKEKAAKKNAVINGPKSWLGDDEEWEVAGGEDDFEIFLASVKARSQAARAQILGRQGSGDGQSSSSSTPYHKDRSMTEASSIDLEWEHEAGVVPQLKPLSSTEDNISGLTSSDSIKNSPQNSNDLEWDNDFINADDLEKEQLLSQPIVNR
ncbi:AP-1 complex-associated regulatory protein-like isoform X1 [Gigantopelta aegis]|uniref:AP-1 complex-associated regulatory protein-like isoform X1 n=1 Tax=Gigantopelta aegis TaxID=1735272 RepID=UPI001B88858E|nr:AP-1 complex-associated regulatory protein-like isoform X1 [Gigantopelta aegis]